MPKEPPVLTRRKTLAAPLWALGCIETYSVWQMGVVFYSSRSFALGGASPLPVPVGSIALAVFAGYALACALAFFLPERTVLWARGLCCLSLACILLLFAPLPDRALTFLYCAVCCFCAAFVGAAAALSVCFYSLRTALADGLIAALLSGPMIALLHSGLPGLGFRAFNAVSAAAQLLILLGLSRLPGRLPSPFPPRSAPAERRRPPRLLLSGTLFVYTAVCLCGLFSSSIADSLPHGIPVYYLSSAAWALLFICLRKRRGADPMLLFTAYLGAAALGFVLWLLPIPQLGFLSIVLQSAGLTLCSLAWFVGGILFEKWPSRALAPLLIAVAALAVLMHSALTEALRQSPALLYSLYAGAALALLIVYFLIEPFFKSQWLSSLSAGAPEPPRPAPDCLTPREADVARLIAQGYSSADIAAMLFISVQTVRTHTKNIYAKLGVHSRFELAAKSGAFR